MADMSSGNAYCVKSNKPGALGLSYYARWPMIIAIVSMIMALVIGAHTSPNGAYAVCSKEPDKIYTIDLAQSQTQCLVIQGAFVVDTGSLGEFNSKLLITTNIEDPASIQTKWRRVKSIGVLNLLASWNLPIKFIKPGAIIVPGLSGK